jgi:hypothetical protein
MGKATAAAACDIPMLPHLKLLCAEQWQKREDDAAENSFG